MENKPQDNIFNAKLTKRNGKLIYENEGQKALFGEFVKTLSEGQSVGIFLEAHKDDGTLPQLAKIHACIRKLAAEIGYTFDEMKTEIKRKSGLVVGTHKKSFADCSVEELGLVIESLNEAAEMVNMTLPD